MHHRIQAGIGVFFQPPKRPQIELQAIIVAITKQAHAQLLILKQEATKISLKRLNPGAHRHKIKPIIIKRGKVIIDKGFLHAKEMIETICPFRWLHKKHAPLWHGHVIDIVSQRYAIFDTGWLIRCASF